MGPTPAGHGPMGPTPAGHGPMGPTPAGHGPMGPTPAGHGPIQTDPILLQHPMASTNSSRGGITLGSGGMPTVRQGQGKGTMGQSLSEHLKMHPIDIGVLGTNGKGAVGSQRTNPVTSNTVGPPYDPSGQGSHGATVPSRLDVGAGHSTGPPATGGMSSGSVAKHGGPSHHGGPVDHGANTIGQTGSSPAGPNNMIGHAADPNVAGNYASSHGGNAIGPDPAGQYGHGPGAGGHQTGGYHDPGTAGAGTGTGAGMNAPHDPAGTAAVDQFGHGAGAGGHQAGGFHDPGTAGAGTGTGAGMNAPHDPAGTAAVDQFGHGTGASGGHGTGGASGPMDAAAGGHAHMRTTNGPMYDPLLSRTEIIPPDLTTLAPPSGSHGPVGPDPMMSAPSAYPMPYSDPMPTQFINGYSPDQGSAGVSNHIHNGRGYHMESPTYQGSTTGNPGTRRKTSLTGQQMATIAELESALASLRARYGYQATTHDVPASGVTSTWNKGSIKPDYIHPSAKSQPGVQF